MRAVWKTTLIASAALAAICAEVQIGPLPLPAAAHAIIGRPMTPISYAGAARRTVRRAPAVYASVAVTTAATATAIAASQAAAASAARAAAPPPQAAGDLPLGTIVGALPPGCTSTPVHGVNYFYCHGVFYRPAFQSNNLVYVVAQP